MNTKELKIMNVKAQRMVRMSTLVERKINLMVNIERNIQIMKYLDSEIEKVTSNLEYEDCEKISALNAAFDLHMEVKALCEKYFRG